MKYMDKGTLAVLIKKVKKIPENKIGIITYQVIKDLAYIQKNEINDKINTNRLHISESIKINSDT